MFQLYSGSYVSLVLLFVIPLATCHFNRGDRYWNGRPQPIGIDFSYMRAVAVYADGPDNFTEIGIASPPTSGNGYLEYMYALFNRRNNWEESAFVDDGLAEFHFGSDAWSHPISSLVASSNGIFNSMFCSRRFRQMWSGLSLDMEYYWDICDADNKYVPQKPPSKYQYLLPEGPTHLQSLVPNWLLQRSLPGPLTRGNFVLSVLDLLEQLKSTALEEHNITITSASVSIPDWAAYNEIGDMFDEACLLANIEVYEQPKSRIEAAVNTVQIQGAILVIDHGQYHLDIYRNTKNMDPQESGGSMGSDEHGMMWILTALVNQIIGVYVSSNVTDIKPGWLTNEKYMPLVRGVDKARSEIKFEDSWPSALEFSNRTAGVNLTDATGVERVLNMTGQDVIDAEAKYVEEVRQRIQTTILRHRELDKYLKDHPLQETRDRTSHIIDTVPPPSNVDSWLQSISAIVILTSQSYVELLYEAAYKALNWPLQDTYVSNTNTCVPLHEIAARGAALRAKDWIVYYDASYDDDESGWDDEEGEDDGEDDDEGGDGYIPF